ncbi:MAG: cyclic nucleotide-binding domain-containing protein [Candidatus Marinimicrobia bacterium]|jgi:CRP-like cAMP-binding protein|nr:cyclic nucleotide-binding domain-containing protein [Candidatus Neomarinimicrobiota bacterium]MDP6592934.1 cyclic nucleotide-binding domain-containing protein [Candidatus Neomarinimicrobiota bacterium]MDP6835818.1 cyclic nucleotide-binding domain-containing protein [Candidatus Neomarinimicrobiota bacterium]MDP6967079.1 cyclic nucleotide-binding domain-containing protein [Candidatus Neomarinimicrobiota bacterium]|tara:strand:- start:879 stop:1385 length:507 start_codon:yes stop_codon:yes gene_type:complete
MTESVDFGQYRIFKDLSDDEIKQFENVMQIKNFEAEQIIFNEGDIGDSIYLLLDGKVEINQALTMQLSKGDYDTREKAIISLPSEWHPVFGEMSIFGNDDKRTATVKAQTDCEMAVVMNDDLFTICGSNPELGYKVMRNVAAIVTDNLVKANQNVLKLTTAFSLILEK